MNSPAQTTSILGNDNIVVQADDSVVNVTVQSRRPQLRLTQFVRQSELAARGPSEIALLSAYRADVVSLIGRDREIGELQRWLDGPAPVSIRVLGGAGGRGKTRLALELARVVSKDGWLAGFATTEELDRFRGQDHVEQWGWDKPVLIIIDYAASRTEQIRVWLSELVDASLEDRPRLRLLLLERQANRAFGWLPAIFGLGDNDNSLAAIALLDPQEPVELSQIDELEFRRTVFATLLTRANAALAAPAPGADPEFDRLLGDRKWAGDPLYLMMAGLAAAKSGVRKALSLPCAELALSMARKELDRIGKIGAAHGVDVIGRSHSGRFVRHMAVMATLLQGLTLVEARGLATTEREALGSAASLDATMEALADALPESGDGVAPILPDVIGEAAILAWLGPKGGIGRGVDHEARIASAARLALAKVSSSLVRTAQDFAAAGHVEPIQWLESLADAPETDLAALMDIRDALPHQTLALTELAVTLAQRIVNSLAGPAAAEANAGSDFALQSLYAASLSILGVRLGQFHRREDAFAATRAATNAYRRLATERPKAFLPHLARTLNNLGVRMSELGQREDALAAAQEAVDIRRRLAGEQPDAFLPDLATSLNNLGVRLGELGRREDALAAAEEATGIYRLLAAEQPDAFRPDFAASLSNLGNRLSALGRRDEALRASQESIEIRRHLADERPDAFLPDLAKSLNNLGNRMSELGRREEALAAAQEAVKAGQSLAKRNDDTFRPDLALSLNNLGNRLSDLGRREDAHAAAQEAVTLLAPFFFRLPAARAQWMLVMCGRYLELSEKAGVEPDAALLNPIAEAFEKLEGSSDSGPLNNA
jgi:tetratricopeptide (TPR) repeat protein